jgi:hypothetical protein
METTGMALPKRDDAHVTTNESVSELVAECVGS